MTPAGPWAVPNDPRLAAGAWVAAPGEQLELVPEPLPDPDANAPGRRHRAGQATEDVAAELAAPRSGTARSKVLAYLQRVGGAGATDEEIAAATGLRLYTAAPRRGELVRDGWAEPTGRRRETSSGTPAIVWALTDRGRRELEGRP